MPSTAQINHVFTFLITIFIIGAVALIGASSLFNILGQKEQIDYISFKETILNEIDQNNIYGTITKRSFSAPAKTNRLCILSSTVIEESSSELSFPEELTPSQEFILKDSVGDGIQTNVFLTTEDIIIPIGYSKKAVVEDGVSCFNSTNGKFDLVFKGQGRTTHITS
ncbi:MAG: hypothetical protein ACQESC_01860 [Nanobdellota archaeon]